MPKANAITLGVDQGYFKKSCGYVQTKGGGTRAKTFVLGPVSIGRKRAADLFLIIQGRWLALKSAGHTTWPENELEALDRQKAQTQAGGQIVPVAAAQPVQQPVLGVTLRSVADQYLAMLDKRAEQGQCDPDGVNTERSRLKTCFRLMPDDQITTTRFNSEQLLSLVLKICSRPNVITPNNKPRVMSAITASAYKKSLRSLLVWAASTRMPNSEKPYWVRPLDFDQIFRQNQPKETEAERKAKIVNRNAIPMTFTIDELCHLYTAAASNANKYGQLFMLLGLNLAFANEEAASLKRWEIIDLDGSVPRIERHRGKTGIYAAWPLWAETAQLLRELDCSDNPEELMLLTPEGNRLVIGRSDYVGCVWKIIYKRLPEKLDKIGMRVVVDQPKRLSFKFLRKTSSSIIRTELRYGQHSELRYGEKIADAFLSHSEQGEIAAYTAQDWAQVAEAVAKLREYLQPMFKAAAEAEKANSQQLAA